jgi:SAM-dependent methyltransferase
MDAESRLLMQEVIKEYDFGEGTVVDIGSYDINGTYRDLISGKYIGVDIVPGPNVDILMDSPEWNDLKDVDAVISGQTIEHVADIPKLMEAIFKVLKPGGILCIIAPSAGDAHNYPIWVGHFPEDKMREVITDGGFEVLSCTVSDVDPWRLTRCVAKKPERTTWKKKEDDEDQ